MKHNNEVGIRALKQNASAVVAKAAAGEVITITSRGTPVARLTPIPDSRLQELTDAGLVVPASRKTAELPDPIVGPSLSEMLAKLRDEERY
ncbi:MAG: type II toxin-antitoxin system prevent-host-death family antitoxin [Chloroflexota bacterium]|nr:type II toxin-antitoxin system prevent-host-death family antitoxin [Chloroflexota bacterium]